MTKIAKKINHFFLYLAASFLLLAALLFNQSTLLKNLSDETELHWMTNIIVVNALNTAISDYRSALAEYVISTVADDREEYEQTLQHLSEDIGLWQSRYSKYIKLEQDTLLYERFLNSYQDYATACRQVITFMQNDEYQKAATQFRHNRDLFNILMNSVQQLVEFNNAGNKTIVQRNAQAFSQIQHMTLLGGGLLAGILLVVFILIRINIALNLTHETRLRQINKKLSLAFLTILLLVGVFIGLFQQQLTGVNRQINALYDKWVPSIMAINALNTKISEYRVTESRYVLYLQDEDELKQMDQHIKILLHDITDLQQQYQSMLNSVYEHNLYNGFLAGYTDYINMSQKTLELVHQRDGKKAGLQLKRNSVGFADFRAILDELVRLNQRTGIEKSRDSNADLQSLKITILGGGIVILLLLGIMGQLVQAWLDVAQLDITQNSHEVRGPFTVKLKLRLAFLGMVATFVLFSLMINHLMERMNQQTHALESNWIQSIILINSINTLVSDYRIAESQNLLVKSEVDTLLWGTRRKRILDKLNTASARYESLISSDEERNIYKSFIHKHDEYMARSEKMLALSRNKQDDLATGLLLHNRITFEAFNADLMKLVHLNSRGGMESAHLTQNMFTASQQLVFAVVSSIFMLAILFMVLFDRHVSMALQNLTALMHRLASGDMRDDATALKIRQDEIGEMADAVSVVTQTLQALSTDVIELTESAQSGMLSVRADTQRHPGTYGRLVAGMNKLLDVLGQPLTEVAQIMQNLALGDLEGRMQGNYEGELRVLQSNVNRSLDSLANLLSELGVTLQNLANADLTHSLQGHYQGEFSVLKANTNQTIQQLIELLKEISQNTAQSAVAVTQTSEASKYVAEASAHQMLAVEQVSKTLEETSASVREIAEKTREGSQLATVSAQSASEGQVLLNKLIQLIQHLDAEYGRIEQITDEITRIADKTHLLSLNAGLESMRAGQQGAAFGFVAQQIGQLSEEVTLSARNIGSVISSSGQKIRLGVHATQETQAAMEQIAEAAHISQKNVQAISAAIVQQSASVTSLTERVRDIRNSSETTASASEQISATMAHLAETIRNTAAQAARFKL